MSAFLPLFGNSRQRCCLHQVLLPAPDALKSRVKDSCIHRLACVLPVRPVVAKGFQHMYANSDSLDMERMEGICLSGEYAGLKDHQNTIQL
jgi:hypothetical protein